MNARMNFDEFMSEYGEKNLLYEEADGYRAFDVEQNLVSFAFVRPYINIV